MIINRSNLDNLYTSYNGAFRGGLAATRNTFWQGVAMELPSTSAKNLYPWLNQIPGIRKWTGDRQLQGIGASKYELENEDYEESIVVDRNNIEDDSYGIFAPLMTMMGDECGRFRDQLAFQVLSSGFAVACYDGQYFFDTDHAEGDSGAQSNKINVAIAGLPAAVHGSTSAPSVEEMQQAILKGIVQILSFVDDRGEPMNENAQEFLVMVPAGLSMVAYAAVSGLATAALAQNLNPNLLKNFRVNVAVNVRLTIAGWTTKFAVFRTDSPVKALIRQSEQEIELKMKAEGSEFEFDNDAWQFGLDGWRGVGYGHWQRAVQVTLT